MMSKQCEIVQDLLPLYTDGACSAASASLVEEHIRDCKKCRSIYVALKSDNGEKLLKIEAMEVISRRERTQNIRIFEYFITAIRLLYLPAILIIPLLFSDNGDIIAFPYIFEVAILLLYSLPFFLSFSELGGDIIRFLRPKEATGVERRLNTICFALSVAITLTAFSIHKLLYLSLFLTLLLITLQIIRAVKNNSPPKIPDALKEKSFYICFGAVILAISLFFALGFSMERSKHKIDDAAPQISSFEPTDTEPQNISCIC